MNEFLGIIQHELHMAVLAFMGIAYVLRIIWLLNFSAARERTLPAGQPAGVVVSSLLAVAKPWTREGSNRNPVFYVQFVLFHLGAAAAISLTYFIPYRPELLKYGLFMRTLQITLGAAFVVGLLRLYRRLAEPSLRMISTPDDYFALIMMTAFYAAALGAISVNSLMMGNGPLWAFFLMAAFFHFYVPFSKIIHYLYYPFTRYYLGKTMGHRNIGNGKISGLS